MSKETFSIVHPLSDQERERRGRATLVMCTPEEDMARQEFKEQVDVNRVVSQYGTNLFVMNHRGEFHQELDLTTAYQAVEESRAAWAKLPKEVRERYGSWDALQTAAESGELSEFLKPPPASGGGLPDAGGGSPSDSAADG